MAVTTPRKPSKAQPERPGDTPEAQRLADVLALAARSTEVLRRFAEDHTEKCRCPVCGRDDGAIILRILRAFVVTNTVILEDVDSRRAGPLNTPEEVQKLHEEVMARLDLPSKP